MPIELAIDESLVQRLPLPLAQLYRRAHNAKTPLERHLTAFYLWEASLKLLGSVAVVEYAEVGHADAKLSERLTSLARPSLGHWWEFVRLLVPILADRGEVEFQKVRDLVLGRTRDDLPRAAGLDAALREALEGHSGARSTVRLTELFDRLVQYRNRQLGHGAAARLPIEFHDRMGRTILAGVAEVLDRLDVLAGRRLVYIADVRRQASGGWLIERSELTGEIDRRIEPLELAASEAGRLPWTERVFLDMRTGEGQGLPLRSLHPLLVYDPEKREVLFLNARRGRQRTEYLGYTTGQEVDRPNLGGEHRELLARVLAMEVAGAQVEEWAVRSQAEESPVETPVASPARLVGEFELLSQLGRGGMGVVYRAWQPSLGRQVALKCLLRSGDAKAEARFAREIHALGRVDHPHVVRIFTSGSEADQWFYAMELVEGATLATVCEKLQSRTSSAAGVDQKTWQEAVSTACEETRKAEKLIGDSAGADVPNPLPAETPVAAPLAGSYVSQIVELIRQVAEAAHALHETKPAGVIHRDIKPGNIMVRADGTQAVLMDLGLAQIADAMEGKLTRTRQFVGTLRYASPEQVLAVDRLDRRSDVYSLGATLWELLTLRPMFGATEETPTPDLMKRIQYAEPERVRKYHPGVPAELEAVVMKCLEKGPQGRYTTARELAEDLARWQQGQPVSAHPLTFRYVLAKYLRRHHLAVATAAAGTVMLALLYIALADAKLGLPGGDSLRNWLDRHEASVFRPIPGDPEVRHAAAALRRVLFQTLKRARTKSGWISRSLDSNDEAKQMWSHSQALYALFSTPDADEQELHDSLGQLEIAFAPGVPVENQGVKYGWRPRQQHDHTMAEPALWTAAALAAALARPGLLGGEARRRAGARFAYTQEATKPYRPLPTGGWNMYPNQKVLSQHSPYSTALALLALLEARQAGLAWEGSPERRDALLKATAQRLVDTYDAEADPPGWRSPVNATYKTFDGLTLQIYALLLRTEAEAGFSLPDRLSENIPRHLVKCGDRGPDFEDTFEIFQIAYTDLNGKERLGSDTVTFLWYPWAIDCSVRWLRRAERGGTPVEDRARVRRALGHLVMGIGKDAVAKARSEWTFRASETLIGFAAIPPPDCPPPG